MSTSPMSPVLRDMRLQGRLALAHPRRAGAAPPAHVVEPVAEQAAEQATDSSMAEEARRRGYDEGFAQGLARGNEEAERRAAVAKKEAERERAAQAEQSTRELTAQLEARYSARIERLDALIAALPPQIDARLAAAEDDLNALCFETICRVLGAHAVRPEAVRSQLSQSLKALRGRRLVAVHLHPDDLAALRTGGDARPAGFESGDIEWIASPDVALGGCILQSPEGGLDTRLETQIDVLRDTLLRARAGGLP